MTGVSLGPPTCNFSLALRNNSGSSNRSLLKMAPGYSTLSGWDGEAVIIKAACMFQDYLVGAAFVVWIQNVLHRCMYLCMSSSPLDTIWESCGKFRRWSHTGRSMSPEVGFEVLNLPTFFVWFLGYRNSFFWLLLPGLPCHDWLYSSSTVTKINPATLPPFLAPSFFFASCLPSLNCFFKGILSKRHKRI